MAYGEADLRSARSLARRGAVGQLTITHEGEYAALAAVDDRDDTWTVQLSCERLAQADRLLFTELVAASAGRVAALLAGDLPHALVEDGEQAGLELLPYSGDLSSTCGCQAWVDPCRHALAVGYQLGWLIDRDPFVLLQVRGIARDDLLADLHGLTIGSEAGGALGAGAGLADVVGGPGDPSGDPEDDDLLADLAVAAEAADRAARALALLAQRKPFAHLF